jgi:glycosyltransferase involved in cell wall biosynthesis
MTLMGKTQGQARGTPLVSIVIIFLNAQRFIRDAIESVLRQTYDNWELILVDDGSTDDSTQIAKSYAGGILSRIRYLQHKNHCNRGMSASRNFGIRSASGNLIATLDSDDVWAPLKLEEQVRIMAAHPEVGMVYGRTIAWQTWSGNKKRLRRDLCYPYRLEADRVYEPPDLLRRMLRGTTQAPSMSNVLFRRQAYEQSEGFEESFVGAFEDGVFMAKLLICHRVFVSGSVWDKYRIHPESSSGKMISRGLWHQERMKYLTWLDEYVSHSQFDTGEIRSALQVAFRKYRHTASGRFGRSTQRLKAWARLFLQPGETLRVEAGNIRLWNPLARQKSSFEHDEDIGVSPRT